MRRFPYPKTIRGKIMSITAGVTFLITIITVSICFFVFQSFLQKNQLQSAEFHLQLVANNISSDIKDIIYLNKWCSSNSNVLKYLETFRGKEKLAIASKSDKTLKPLALSTYARLKEEYFGTKPSAYITRIIISSNNSNNILQVMSNSSDSSPRTSTTLTSSEYFPTLYNSPDYNWIGFIDDPFFANVKQRPILPIVRPIYNLFNSDVIGWTYLSVSSDIITDYLKAYPLAEDSNLFISIGEKFYEIKGSQIIESSRDFTIVSQIQNDYLNSDTKAQIIKLSDGSQRTLVGKPMSPDGWYLYQTLSEQQLNDQRQVYILLIIGICVIIFSLGFLLLMLLNHTINQPVSQIRKKIDAIAHGDFSQDSSIEWDHEIGDIGRGINTLSQDVVALMDKRVGDEKHKKDLEYQILQSQINPHFLYNTLNSIKWMASIQGATGIAEMTTALARLMKNIAKGTNALITLSEELALVKDYFLIQQYRYGGSITIDYNIESEDLYLCKIHRFSLQPMIENALFHGIEPKGSTGKIQVEAYALTGESKKSLQIIIRDNGIGMTPETIHKVLHSDMVSNASADFFKHVGIHNVNRRIQYDFGLDYGITIKSVPGEYTEMIIQVPYIIEENIEGGEDFK